MFVIQQGRAHVLDNVQILQTRRTILLENNKKIDRRIKRTRQFIKRALIQLLAEKSFHAITIQDITERADINRSTFYYHYLDKEDLLQQYMDEMLNEAVKDVSGERSCSEKQTGSYVVYDPAPFFIRMFEHIGKHAEFYRVMLQEIPVFGRRVSNVIQQLYKESISIMQPDESQFVVSKNLLITYVTGAYTAVIISWLENNLPYSAIQMAEQLSQVMTLGPHRAGGLNSVQ